MINPSLPRMTAGWSHPPNPEHGEYFINVRSDRVEQWTGEQWEVVAEAVHGMPVAGDTSFRYSFGQGGGGVAPSPQLPGDPPLMEGMQVANIQEDFTGNLPTDPPTPVTVGTSPVLIATHILGTGYPTDPAFAMFSSAVFVVQTGGAGGSIIEVFLGGVLIGGVSGGFQNDQPETENFIAGAVGTSDIVEFKDGAVLEIYVSTTGTATADVYYQGTSVVVTGAR